MEQKNERPKLIKLNEEGRSYLDYKCNLIELNKLSNRRKKLHKIIPLLQYLKPDMSPKEYIDRLENEQTLLRKKVSEYKKHKIKKKDRYQTIKKADFNKVRICNQISSAQSRPLYLMSPDQLQPSTYRKILSQIGNCQIVHELKHTPSDFHIYKEEGPLQEKSEGGAEIYEVFSAEKNGIEIETDLTDKTVWYWFDWNDHVFAMGVHSYILPPPSCDSLITVYMNFRVDAYILEHDAEWGALYVDPVIYASPTGATPSYYDLLPPTCDYGIRASLKDGEYDKCYTGFDFNHNDYAQYRIQYYVNANVISSIYFGLSVLLFAQEGTFNVRSVAELEYPPGAIAVTEGGTPPFSPPRSGIQYISWAKSMFPDCYITTAICSVLGKPDDCYELNLLRNFRDSYIKTLPDGNRLIKAYYDKAPYISRLIDRSNKKKKILLHLYNRYLKRCIKAIEEGNKDKAVFIYKDMVLYVESLI